MDEKQFPKYAVLPDVTHPKNTVYLVVEVKTRNEDGSIAAFEKVAEYSNNDDAQQMTQQLNGHS